MNNGNSELVMLRLNYDIEKLKHFLYLAEQSQKEASEIIAELKAENTKLKELLETRCYNGVEFENKKLKEQSGKIKEKINAHCAFCETMRRPKCDDCILSWLLEIIEGAKNDK